MKVIIGVTTTKARLGLFFYTLQSLKRQTYDDFTIYINLSKEPYLFDDGIDTVPDWMTGDNIRVNFVDNSGPYRKLIPLLETIGGDDVVVTADDDVLYSENWLKRIVESALLYPNYIVCGRARRIQKNIIGLFQNYANWPLVRDRATNLFLLPIGISGIAYRIGLLDLEFAMDEAYFDYAPTADDMWFRLASIRKNTKVYVDPEIDKENAHIGHLMGLERVNLQRPIEGRRLFERVIIKTISKFINYFGIPLSQNDFAWRRSLEYSKSMDDGSAPPCYTNNSPRTKNLEGQITDGRRDKPSDGIVH